MKRILFLVFAVGLTANMTVMAGMSTSKVRKETRFLTDKMAYELSLSTFFPALSASLYSHNWRIPMRLT